MIGFVLVGTNDLNRAMCFYNEICASLGAKRGVDRVHALALSLGGTNEGTPGPRGNGTAYCAYFRDPDGNKLCIYHQISEANTRSGPPNPRASMGPDPNIPNELIA